MANRTTRRAYDFKQMARDAWSEWEWLDVASHEKAPHDLLKACLNNVYSVQFFQKYTAWGIINHLMVRRHDAKPIRSWSDMQRIKNELIGSDRVGVEVYPSVTDVVDDANIYHLWVLPAGYTLPFGLHL
ncbi:DUF7694 domain-containing protein [Chroococcidiopsis sp.]|uniref:DUF7694 domain-containing protein n=1 Tax=Chroococcidiopsis sp. TaxID=3088168 RepID=UPI003F3E780E